eukprot:scaffold393030_cov44-Prasinocladus_malaysianus.AAC.3
MVGALFPARHTHLAFDCAGYSAILIAQKLQKGASLVTIDNDLKFFLATKRFLWQASQGEANKQRDEPLGSKVGNA